MQHPDLIIVIFFLIDDCQRKNGDDWRIFEWVKHVCAQIDIGFGFRKKKFDFWFSYKLHTI